MSTENLFKMSVEELQKAYEDAKVRELQAKTDAQIFHDEMASREFDVRLGQRLQIEDKEYVVAAFSIGYWPELKRVDKDGRIINKLRQCYNWEEWCSGAKTNPF